MKKIKKIALRLLWIVLTVFVLMNIVAYFHASKFTHFDDSLSTKTKDAKQLTFGQKLKAIVFGVDNPRPENKITPVQPFETIKLKSNIEIECWLIKTDSSKGTVILFHGYSGNKSTMLDKATMFIEQGYNTMLVDFMGSGGSEGNQTTLGFFEAVEVKSAFDYIKSQGKNDIYLFGTSMGAVAIMKALNDYNLDVKGIILECPFGSMLKTVQLRFKTMSIPGFPMANLLVFWGGVQNGFNGFNHMPTEYAKNIYCPTLLLYGMKDEKVTGKEIHEIFSNIKGEKSLKTFLNSGHENYLNEYKTEWTEYIKAFINHTKEK